MWSAVRITNFDQCRFRGRPEKVVRYNHRYGLLRSILYWDGCRTRNVDITHHRYWHRGPFRKRWGAHRSENSQIFNLQIEHIYFNVRCAQLTLHTKIWSCGPMNNKSVWSHHLKLCIYVSLGFWVRSNCTGFIRYLGKHSPLCYDCHKLFVDVVRFV